MPLIDAPAFQLQAIELFSGAGGLSLGISRAGFKPLAIIEWDKWACDTMRKNQKAGFSLVADWPIIEKDVRHLNLADYPQGLDLIAGGPPCQPFSIAGKHGAYDDTRNMFPAMINSIQQLNPSAFIIENVKGLTRCAFANYYQYILLQLEFPDLAKKQDEEWPTHLRRLQREKTTGRHLSAHPALTYNVVSTLVNAADFGVPQKRERIFIVGFRSDLAIQWSFPQSTHSLDALLQDQWLTGEYWDRHAKTKPLTIPSHLVQRIQRLSTSPHNSTHLFPWQTIRDAFVGLPNPEEKSDLIYANHHFQPGAKVYSGHTGSILDLPAKTLKAGDHGVPGGENMVVMEDERVRYFTVRESARLQTFPDGYHFYGSWTETMRQLGNAVPVSLAYIVASSVAQALIEYHISKNAPKIGNKVA